MTLWRRSHHNGEATQRREPLALVEDLVPTSVLAMDAPKRSGGSLTEKRVYVIVPRNLTIPTEPPQNVTVTCGVASGYTGHATSLLQLAFAREFEQQIKEHAPKFYTNEGPINAGPDGGFAFAFLGCTCGWNKDGKDFKKEGDWTAHLPTDLLAVSFQFILTLMVSSSGALDDAMFWLAQKKIRYWKYEDEDKKFPGKVLAAVVTEPLDDAQAEALRTFKPWRCACNSVHNHSTEKK